MPVKVSPLSHYQRHPLQEWSAEYRLFSHWAYWVNRANHATIHTFCGQTPEGTPYGIMDRIWQSGAVDETEVTGYAQESSVHDYIVPEVDRFMQQIQPIMPRIYDALTARHRRLIYSQKVLIRNERWMARALYGGHAGEAYLKLCRHCEIGYGMLKVRLDNFLERYK